jgi:hypothetical protein
MIKDFEPNFLYLLAMFTSSESCLLNSFALLLIWLFVVWLFSFLSSFYILNIHYLFNVWWRLPTILGWSLDSCNYFLHCTEAVAVQLSVLVLITWVMDSFYRK